LHDTFYLKPLLAHSLAAAQAQHEVQRAVLLDFVVGKRVAGSLQQNLSFDTSSSLPHPCCMTLEMFFSVASVGKWDTSGFGFS
jgi:hypothetical protein